MTQSNIKHHAAAFVKVEVDSHAIFVFVTELLATCSIVSELSKSHLTISNGCIIKNLPLTLLWFLSDKPHISCALFDVPIFRFEINLDIIWLVVLTPVSAKSIALLRIDIKMNGKAIFEPLVKWRMPLQAQTLS